MGQASCYLPKYMVDPKICFCCEQKESDLPGVGVLQGESRGLKDWEIVE